MEGFPKRHDFIREAPSNTGDRLKDFGIDLDRAAEIANKASAAEPGKRFAIIMGPAAFLEMAEVSSAKYRPDPERRHNILTNALKIAFGSSPGREVTEWSGVPIYVDPRVPYINVALIKEDAEGIRGEDAQYNGEDRE